MVKTMLRYLVTAALAAAAAAQQPGAIAIDKQEWRTDPVKHLYVHGTLNGDTAFHVYLPERTAWKGRLVQYLQGGLGGSEFPAPQAGLFAAIVKGFFGAKALPWGMVAIGLAIGAALLVADLKLAARHAKH